jgi:hypothetical protein
MTLEEARNNIGKFVIYTPFSDFTKGEIHRLQYGFITSVNDRYVFVRYGDGDTSAATDPNDLKLGVSVDEGEAVGIDLNKNS